MAKPQKPKRKKGARKKFFEVKIPLTATKIYLYSYSPEDLEGNVIKLDLTKNLRGKNLEFKARIKLNKNELTGELISLHLLPSYIRKVMRRGTDYIEDSFEETSKDARIKIKPLMITRKRVSRAVRKAIRENARKYLQARIKSRNTEELFSEIMTSKLQKELSLKIKKIYPLAFCEIRIIKVIRKTESKSKYLGSLQRALSRDASKPGEVSIRSKSESEKEKETKKKEEDNKEKEK